MPLCADLVASSEYHTSSPAGNIPQTTLAGQMSVAGKDMQDLSGRCLPTCSQCSNVLAPAESGISCQPVLFALMSCMICCTRCSECTNQIEAKKSHRLPLRKKQKCLLARRWRCIMHHTCDSTRKDAYSLALRVCDVERADLWKRLADPASWRPDNCMALGWMTTAARQ